jgi:hypothetical protein
LAHYQQRRSDHRFAPGEAAGLADATSLELTSWRDEAQDLVVETVVSNRSLPHSIPAGEYGYRELVLLIRAEDVWGSTLARHSVSFFRELGTDLAPLESRRFLVRLAGAGPAADRVRAQLWWTSVAHSTLFLVGETMEEIGPGRAPQGPIPSGPGVEHAASAASATTDSP